MAMLILPISVFLFVSAAASFTVSDDSYGPDPVVKLKVLRNVETGENVSITYTSGGGVEELFLTRAPDAANKSRDLRKVLTTR